MSFVKCIYKFFFFADTLLISCIAVVQSDTSVPNTWNCLMGSKMDPKDSILFPGLINGAATLL